MEKVEIIGKVQMKKTKRRDKKRNKKKQRDFVKSAKCKRKQKKEALRRRIEKLSFLRKKMLISHVNEIQKPTFDKNAFGSSAPIIGENAQNAQNVLEKKEGFDKSAWSS